MASVNFNRTYGDDEMLALNQSFFELIADSTSKCVFRSSPVVTRLFSELAIDTQKWWNHIVVSITDVIRVNAMREITALAKA